MLSPKSPSSTFAYVILEEFTRKVKGQEDLFVKPARVRGITTKRKVGLGKPNGPEVPGLGLC